MSKVLLISPPYMKLSYPSYGIPIALTNGCNYMNPGLLISSSILNSKGISNKIIKIENINDLKKINAYIDDTVLVGISCTCAWEYLESLKIAEMVKKINNKIKVALAGWQIKSIKSQVFSDSPNIDYLILGDAEYTIFNLYRKVCSQYDDYIPSVIERDKEILVSKYPNINFTTIDFRNFPDYLNYIPYVEESRNCPNSCQFCLNSCVSDRYQNVPFEIFKRNVELLEEAYGSYVNANLLAANFGVNYIETKKKLEYLKTKNIKWNIELHVDNHWEKYIDDFKAAGIVKASIGFESGSTKILKLMNKTSNPEEYLKRTRVMLQELNSQNIKASLNLLIDYRETKETSKETLKFLNENKDYFKRVKVNFMFAFGEILNNIDYNYLPNIIMDDYGRSIHAFPILPSWLTLKEVEFIINNIEQGNFSSNLLNNSFQKKLK